MLSVNVHPFIAFTKTSELESVGGAAAQQKLHTVALSEKDTNCT